MTSLELGKESQMFLLNAANNLQPNLQFSLENTNAT